MLARWKDYLGLVSLIIALGGMAWGWASGGYVTWAAMSAFVAPGGELEQLRAELAQAAMTQAYIRTVDGDTDILNTTDRGVLLISRRLLFRRGEKVVLTGIEQSAAPSFEVVIAGDFLPANRSTIAAVSPDLAQKLGITKTKRQVQVKPVSK